MWRTPHPKRINIMLEPFTLRVQGRIHSSHSLAEFYRIVDTLGAGDDFLAAHEGVVGVCEVGVFGVEMGVEGPGGDGIVC